MSSLSCLQTLSHEQLKSGFSWQMFRLFEAEGFDRIKQFPCVMYGRVGCQQEERKAAALQRSITGICIEASDSADVLPTNRQHIASCHRRIHGPRYLQADSNAINHVLKSTPPQAAILQSETEQAGNRYTTIRQQTVQTLMTRT